jgi:DNA (cytosine-5)-methyltransferase 1
MKYGSVCSGIEAASVAWHPLGWEPQWFSEIESFPSEVLKQRFPDIPNLGDMTKLTLNPTFNEKSIDLLVGGTPCQSFSVAGLRGGLADPRGNLMLTFLGLADAKKPKWIVWENVPGVLSSNGGKDFGTFLGALAELGYGFAYRVLDAQHFGVAQRRRRVFVVGHLGDWRPAAAVLFESESLQRNPKQSRAKREETPTDAQGCVRATSPDGRETIGTLRQRDYKGIGNDDLESGRGLAVELKQVAQPQYFESHPNDSRVTGPHDVGNTVSARYGTGGGNTPIVSQPIAVDAYNQTINEKTTQTIGSSASDVNHYGAVLQPTIIDRAAFNQGQNAQYEPRIEEGQTMSSLVAKGPHAVQHTMAIRRLTPKECERLQGFPDDWTKIHYHKNGKSKECPDGPRYKACGNSMAVPVMRWIGERIEKIEKMLV